MAFRNISKLPAIFTWPSALLSAPLQQRDTSETTMTTYFFMSIWNIWENIYKNIWLRWAAAAPISQPCYLNLNLHLHPTLALRKGGLWYISSAHIVTVQLGCDVATDRAGAVSRHEARPGRSQDTCHQQRLSGLGVWFSLWVREVPGSNPGWAHFWTKEIYILQA